MSSRRTAPPTRKSRRGRRGQHYKMYGYVHEIQGKKWWAIIRDDEVGDDLFVEMNEEKYPLPATITEPGYLFSVHTTKAGHTYIYWLPAPKITKARRKQIQRRVNELARFFKDVE